MASQFISATALITVLLLVTVSRGSEGPIRIPGDLNSSYPVGVRNSMGFIQAFNADSSMMAILGDNSLHVYSLTKLSPAGLLWGTSMG